MLYVNHFGTRIDNASKQLLNYFWFQNGFSPEECNKVIEVAKNYPQQNGGTFTDTYNEKQYRKSNVRWIELEESYHWIYEKLMFMADEANKVFSLDITGFTDNLQFTEYEGAGSKYGYHMDIGPDNWHRKLSIVVQLSNPNAYTGGELVLNTGGNEIHCPNEWGSVIIFPSILQHEVMRIQSGNRYSLVSWISGAPWK